MAVGGGGGGGRGKQVVLLRGSWVVISGAYKCGLRYNYSYPTCKPNV